MKLLSFVSIILLLLVSGAKAQYYIHEPLKAYDGKAAQMKQAEEMRELFIAKGYIKVDPVERAAEQAAKLEAYKLELLRLQTEAAIRAAQLAELQNARREQEAFLRGKIIIPSK